MFCNPKKIQGWKNYECRFRYLYELATNDIAEERYYWK
jgi:hypothetical protein